MAGVPSDTAPIVDAQGKATPSWRAFFAALAGQGGKSSPVQPRPSPFTWTAPERGSLIVQGSLTGLSLTRGRDVIALNPTLSLIPVGAGDTLLLAYSAAPGLVFLPA